MCANRVGYTVASYTPDGDIFGINVVSYPLLGFMDMLQALNLNP